MTNCPECGKPVSETDVFCPSCGKSLRRKEYCPLCGASLSGDPKSCPSCGKALHEASPTAKIPGYDKDKKTIAGILALLLGGLGIHYFYLGKTTAGIITIALFLCTCGVWHALMLVQGIIMLIMSDEDFYAKYVNTDRSFPLF